MYWRPRSTKFPASLSIFFLLPLDGGVYGLDETRSFMFVDDFIELLMALTFESGIKQNYVYNIGSQNEVPIKDLTIKIKNILKLDLDI